MDAKSIIHARLTAIGALTGRPDVLIACIADASPYARTHQALIESIGVRRIARALVGAAIGSGARVAVALGRRLAGYTADFERELASSAKVYVFDERYPLDDRSLRLDLQHLIPQLGDSSRCVFLRTPQLAQIAAALRGDVATRQIVAVVGAVRDPALFEVPLGTPLSELVAQANPTAEAWALYESNPFRGDRLAPDAAVDLKTHVVLVVGTEHSVITRRAAPLEQLRQQVRASCTHCHVCTDACTAHLNGEALKPDVLMRQVAREGYIGTRPSGCVFCGVCTLQCPAGLFPNRVLQALVEEPPREVGEPHADRASRRMSLEVVERRLGLGAVASGPIRRIEPDKLVVPLTDPTGLPRRRAVHVGARLTQGDLISDGEGTTPVFAAGTYRVADIDVDDGLVLRR